MANSLEYRDDGSVALFIYGDFGNSTVKMSIFIMKV